MDVDGGCRAARGTGGQWQSHGPLAPMPIRRRQTHPDLCGARGINHQAMPHRLAGRYFQAAMRTRRRLQAVSRALIGGVLVLAMAAAPGSARRRQVTPTRAQVARAVRQAEHSPSLWATVNICNSGRYPDVMGVRGEMPALGFSVRLRMVFEVDYWQYPNNGFQRLPGAATAVDLGEFSRGVYQ